MYRSRLPVYGGGRAGEYPVCPKCGGLMLNVPEEKLTGEQWADLGVFWSRQEEEDTGGQEPLLLSEGDGGRKCLRHDKNLAIYQENGWGLEKDLSTAAWLYEQAAELRVMCRRYYQGLGRCFRYGLGKDRDPEEAFHCYLTAAEVGFHRARMEVGFCCETGCGTIRRRMRSRNFSGISLRCASAFCSGRDGGRPLL